MKGRHQNLSLKLVCPSETMWQFNKMPNLDARVVEACRRFASGVLLEFTEKE
jgi:hypothetical protein